MWALVAAIVFLVAGTACSAPAPPAPPPLCGTAQTAAVSSGAYLVQNNEFDSAEKQCITLTGGTGFTLSESAVANPSDGSPGSYPSIYQGCHWGVCSHGDLAANPMRASALAPGVLTTSWQTTQPGTGVYNVAYDVWFNSQPRAAGQPDCTELMVWLNLVGSVHPFGSLVAASATVGGQRYDVWAGHRYWGGTTVSYVIPGGTDAVSGLDLGVLAADAMRRGYLAGGCYLLDVEAGFEIWQGGAGLGTTAFSVRVSRLFLGT